MMNTNFGTGKHNFGYIPDPNCSEFCHDAAKDETLCETCKFYEECNGIPTCNGTEYREREEKEMKTYIVLVETGDCEDRLFHVDSIHDDPEEAQRRADEINAVTDLNYSMGRAAFYFPSYQKYEDDNRADSSYYEEPMARVIGLPTGEMGTLYHYDIFMGKIVKEEM